jgi:hypothetical protein
MTLETFTTPEKQREKILEFMDIMQDEITPLFLKEIYSRKCCKILNNYTGEDKQALERDYWAIYGGLG